MMGSTRYPGASRLVRITLAVLLLLSAGTVGAEPVSLADAIQAALDRSIEIRQSSLRIASAELREAAVEAATRPSVELTSDPIYSLVTQRIPDPTAVSPSGDFADLFVSSTSVGVGIVQPLPTAGIVTGALDLGFTGSRTVSTALDDADPVDSYSLAPTIVFSYSQPLFVGDDFIEAEQPRLILDQARRGTQETEISGEIIARQIAAAVINLYTQLGTLRRSITLQVAQRELLETQLEQAIIRRESGLGSRDTEIELQIQINRIDDVVLQSELGIAELAIEFERLTGVTVTPDDDLESASLLGERALATVSDRLPSPTSERRAAGIATARAETDLVLAQKQPRMTAQAALSLTPRYQDAREDADLLDAITDYSGTGAGVDVVVSLGITVPLGEEPSRERERAQARIALDLARAEEERLELESRYQLELFAVRIQSIQSRVAFSEFELEFRRDQLANELELVSLGASSQANADSIRSEILAQELALEDLAAQLFLARMDLAAASGFDPMDVLRD